MIKKQDKTKNLIKLRVVEALQDDAYKGIVRIDPDLMRELELDRGDIISIKGDRETYSVVDMAYPADRGEEIIRMDGITRKNSKTGIGERVEIRKGKIQEAKNVTIAPAQKGIMVRGDPDNFKRGLLGKPVNKGDIVVMGGSQQRKDLMSDGFGDLFGGEMGEMFNQMGIGGMPGGLTQVRFLIVSVAPNKPCIITENTQITLNPKAVEISEESIPSITYEDIGGLTDEVKKVREMVELPLKRPEIFSQLGIEPPRGVLLYGPPGTGKTLLAKAIANESEAHFIEFDTAELTSALHGQTEKNIQKLFDEAEKNAPSIIFIDEIDSIAMKREERGANDFLNTPVMALLKHMDGLQDRGKVVVIGATNRPNVIDPALRRPGRFDREVEISVPDKVGRLQILKIHTRGMPLLGSVYSKNISKELPPLIEKLYELKEDELEKLNTKKAKLEEETESEGAILKILNLIKQTNKQIKKIEEIQKILNVKSTLEKTSADIEKLYHLFESQGDKDSRSIFRIRVEKELKKKEKMEIAKLYEIDLISKEVSDKDSTFWNNIRKRGIKNDQLITASKTHGFVGADINSLAKEAAMIVLRNNLHKFNLEEDKEIPQEVLNGLKISQKDFDEAMKFVRPSAMREVLVETPNTKWDDIGGVENVKRDLKEAVEWPLKFPDSFARMGINPPKGVLLYGPPGTGKTLLAKAVANESEANFISVKGPELLSKWVNESPHIVKKFFSKAREVSPCIIFFDEIDSIGSHRGIANGSSQETSKALNQLLIEMDGLNVSSDVLIIAATNRPDILDPALMRPGRFDRIVYVPVPEKEGRLQILKIHTKNMPLDNSVDVEKIAEETEGFTGADIESLAREAAMLALREDIDTKEITKRHFDKAMEKVMPSVSKNDQERYKQVESQYLKSAKAALANSSMSYTG